MSNAEDKQTSAEDRVNPEPATHAEVSPAPQPELPATSDEVTEAPAPGAQPAPAASAQVGLPRPSAFRRVLEWFWRGRAISELVGNSVMVPARARELERRARLCAELGRIALEPPGPLKHGSGEPVACELYRQSIYFALSSWQAAGADPSAGRVPNLNELWHETDQALLLNAAADLDALTEIATRVAGANFVDFAEFDREEQHRLAWELRRFVSGLLASIDRAQVALDRLRIQRLYRVGLLLFLFVIAVPSAALFREWNERRGDLARDRTWKASSHGPPGCESPAQTCGQSPHFFFHTQEEENPWVMIDLGGKREFSEVIVENRSDCCPERVAPLVIEVGSDKNRWKQVASRPDVFSTWKASFPSVKERYVRVRSTRKTILHLARVRVLK